MFADINKTRGCACSLHASTLKPFRPRCSSLQMVHAPMLLNMAFAHTQTITTYNSHLEQKRSNMQPGYEHVVEGSNPSGTGGDTASQPRPPSPVPQDLDHSDAFNPKRRTVSGNVFALPVEQQLPSCAPLPFVPATQSL